MFLRCSNFSRSALIFAVEGFHPGKRHVLLPQGDVGRSDFRQGGDRDHEPLLRHVQRPGLGRGSEEESQRRAEVEEVGR